MILSAIFAAITTFSIDAYSPDMHMPDAQPKDAKETTSFSISAAKGEIESLSFLVKSDEDIDALDVKLGSLKGPDGAEIPVSAMDFHVVKVWFQPAGFWETSWAGNIHRPMPLPAILLHDDAMIKVDWEKKINYLRLDYADGKEYTRMSGPDISDELNHTVFPIRDAASYVPCSLEKGRFKQFWYTVKVPASATPGAYTGTIQLTAIENLSDIKIGQLGKLNNSNNLTIGKSDNRKIGHLDNSHAHILKLQINLTVHPFSLPLPRTHYDTSKRYYVGVENNVTIADFLQQGGDLPHAERKSFNTYKLMAEHNILDPDGPGTIVAETPDDLGYRTFYQMREAGLPMQRFMVAADAKPAIEVFRKYADPGFKAYYCGIDEACEESCRAQYNVWSDVQSAGGYSHSAMAHFNACGWALDSCQTPALISHWHAREWHRVGGIVTTYASPFTGPECPDIWRRTKGLRFYYSDFDGLYEYCFYYHARNRWNEFIPSPDGYRSFGIVYPAYEGMIGTVALEALREGIDDVRYLSLLRLRSEAAIKSGDQAKALAGKKNIAWMDSLDPEYIVDLDAFRLELVRRIKDMITLVGEEPAPKPLPPMAAPGPTSLDKLAVDKFADALKRAEKCVQGKRNDLAIPLYTEVWKDEQRPQSIRINALRSEVELRLGFLDRAGAVKAIDTLAADSGFKQMKSTFDLMKLDAFLTPVKFREKLTKEQLDSLAKTVAQINPHHANAETRFQATWKLAKAMLNSEDPMSVMSFSDEYFEKHGFTKQQQATLRYCRAEGMKRAAPKKYSKEIFKDLKWAADNGARDLTGENRNIQGEFAEFAESVGELKLAQKYYDISWHAWPPANDKWYPRWKAAFERVTKKLAQNPTKMKEQPMEDEIGISLDEE